MTRFVSAGVLFLALSVPAGASLVANIGGTIFGGNVVGGTTYTDNQAGVDANPAIGVLDIGAFLNGVSVNFVIQGFSATSGSPIASLSMNSNSFLAPSALLPLGVNITISDTGYSSPPTPLTLTQTVNLLSSVGGITGSATAVGYYGDSNTVFDVNGDHTGTATGNILGGVGTNTIALSGTITGPALYSLTSAIHLDITARGSDPIQNIQLNGNLAANGEVPEVATLVMLASGLLVMYRLKKKHGKGWSEAVLPPAAPKIDFI